MGFDFSSVGRYDPVPNAITHLNKVVVLTVLVLNFLVLEMLTLLPLLPMLLIEAKSNSLLHNWHILNPFLVDKVSLWRIASKGRTSWVVILFSSRSSVVCLSHVSFTIDSRVSRNLTFPLLSVLGSPLA